MNSFECFAEALAETGSITESAKAAGISRDHGKTYFKRIRRRLGWQAQ